MNIADDLLLKADLDILYWVLGEVAEKVKEDNDFIKVLLQLEQFVEIHKTRTNDMVTYRDTIERARNEYRSLKLKYDGTKEMLTQTRSMLHKVMNEKLEQDVDNQF
jgi:hypothetical protein